ncbi:MAG TPA: hypothetical protein VFW53_05345, partial [Gallionella sp.]|nr:hypothetical protein [Gallionella sp.]
RLITIEVLNMDWHFDSFAMPQKRIGHALTGTNYVANCYLTIASIKALVNACAGKSTNPNRCQ